MNDRYIYLKQMYSIELELLWTSQLFEKYLNGFLPHWWHLRMSLIEGSWSANMPFSPPLVGVLIKLWMKWNEKYKRSYAWAPKNP